MTGKAVARAPRDTAHEGFLNHKRARWAKVAGTLSLVALLSYMLTDPTPRHNGGTWLGYTLGSIGAGLIVWLSLLGVRKRVIGSKPFSLKGWTSAHVYLGLSLIVIGTLHTGFQLGWNVHTLAWALMMIVILSGLWGISLYATLPEKLSANRGEVTQQQMLEAIRTLDRQLDLAAQPLGADDAALVRMSLEECRIAGSLGQRLSGNYASDGNARALAAIGEKVMAGLRSGRADERLQQIQFLLERKEAALAQARRHIAMKARLELWLYIHVPVTIALLAALFAHILSVFLYW
ncbi:hypothetical protein CHU93_06280 [Sandarakinorhabdus cyanobacteriorum]|uniref:Ferric reductase like transmembrane component n=2 Tax=Sandarakinorhabdus cyanobacteriorum TaxID=1981098 RepID=A0A255YNV7_9SPHN|nr:hypothetical protein CHU93_06280 [Sandarakinorhabdus cyanobacteriorum]